MLTRCCFFRQSPSDQEVLSFLALGVGKSKSEIKSVLMTINCCEGSIKTNFSLSHHSAPSSKPAYTESWFNYIFLRRWARETHHENKLNKLSNFPWCHRSRWVWEKGRWKWHYLKLENWVSHPQTFSRESQSLLSHTSRHRWAKFNYQFDSWFTFDFIEQEGVEKVRRQTRKSLNHSWPFIHFE